MQSQSPVTCQILHKLNRGMKTVKRPNVKKTTVPCRPTSQNVHECSRILSFCFSFAVNSGSLQRISVTPSWNGTWDETFDNQGKQLGRSQPARKKDDALPQLRLMQLASMQNPIFGCYYSRQVQLSHRAVISRFVTDLFCANIIYAAEKCTFAI